jgi:ribonuclease HII
MPDEIDELNILHASIKAMHRCAEAEKAQADYLLVDGNRFSPGLCPHKCLVKGDDRSMSIAAASIIAKVFRDKWMIELHEEYPYYGWNTNVGYPTAQHYSGLKEYGYTEYHRQSFKLRTEKEVVQEKTGN